MFVSASSHPVLVSLGYCLVMAVLGATYGMQGPAALSLASQNGLVFRVNCSQTAAAGCRGTDNTTLDTRGLTRLGYANTLDSFAGVFGGLLFGWIVDRSSTWHVWLALFSLWQAAAVVAFTRTHSFTQLLLASLAWGWSSTSCSLSTQAAMTWIWPEDKSGAAAAAAAVPLLFGCGYVVFVLTLLALQLFGCR